MEFEDKCIDKSGNVFMDALEEKDNLLAEITHLKIRLEEAKLAKEDLKKQILEK